MKRSATLFDFAFSGGGSKKKKEDGKELETCVCVCVCVSQYVYVLFLLCCLLIVEPQMIWVMRSVRWGGSLLFLWEGRELPPFFNGREGMTSFFENPRLSSDNDQRVLCMFHLTLCVKMDIVPRSLWTKHYCTQAFGIHDTDAAVICSCFNLIKSDCKFGSRHLARWKPSGQRQWTEYLVFIRLE